MPGTGLTGTPDTGSARYMLRRPATLGPILAVLVLLLTVCSATPQSAIAQTRAWALALGFAELRSLLPEVVGACLEDEQHKPFNGDALQRTTGGLLVWRKADNWTAFTDGFATWVNGPFGLQQRLNTQRFQWEPDPDRLEI